MENEKRLTKEQVDSELKKLEDSYSNGKEDPELYSIKKENLATIRRVVIKGEEKWEKIHREIS